MDGATYVLLSGALTFGVPLALAVRQLMEMKRRDGGWDGDGPAPEVPKPPPPPKSGEKPLPECLIPKLQPRVRELEKV